MGDMGEICGRYRGGLAPTRDGCRGDRRRPQAHQRPRTVDVPFAEAAYQHHGLVRATARAWARVRDRVRVGVRVRVLRLTLTPHGPEALGRRPAADADRATALEARSSVGVGVGVGLRVGIGLGIG